MVKQKSGFSEEPVIKVYYAIHGIPIELQLLGGNIECYMAAKGYSDYKTGLHFAPGKENLTESEWHSRLGNCIYLQETGQLSLFRQMMLDELLGNKVTYDPIYTYSPEQAPLKSANKDLLIQHFPQI